jgi:hypothetical protein
MEFHYETAGALTPQGFTLFTMLYFGALPTRLAPYSFAHIFFTLSLGSNPWACAV